MKTRALVFVGIASFMSVSAFVACSDDSGPPVSPLDATAPDGVSPSSEGGPGQDGGPSNDAGQTEAGDDGGGADLGILADFCTKYAAATCDRMAHCYPNAPSGCAAEQETYCRLYARAELVPAMNAGLITFDPAKAAECLATSPDDYCETNNLWSLTPCRQIFAGTVPTGGSCFNVYFFETRSECKEGTCLPRPDAGPLQGSCTPGVCTPYIAKNAPCTDDAGVALPPGCGPDARCKSTRTCVPAGNLGDPCTDFGELCNNDTPHVICAPQADGGPGYECTQARDAGGLCGNGSVNLSYACRSSACVNRDCVASNEAGVTYCGRATDCAPGTVCQGVGDIAPLCLPPVAVGGVCDNIGMVCVTNSVCTPHDGGFTCDALPTANQPCTGACANGLVCSMFDGGSTCVPSVAAGGACRGAGDDTCVQGLRCDGTTRTCVSFIGFGASCTRDAECERGLYCDSASKRCASWKRTGTACTRNEECVYLNACTDAGVCNSTCTVP